MVRHFTDADRERARELYAGGATVASIANQVGFSLFSTHRALRLMGLRRYQPRPRRHPRADLFAQMDATDRYWLGLLITDGCVCKSRVKLSLKAADRQLVDDFADFVATGGRPTSYASEVTFRFTSAQVATRLAGAGVTPRKTWSAKAAEWLLDDPDFWRGVIDGDGGVHDYRYPLIALTGHRSSSLLDQWADFAARATKGPRPRRVPRASAPDCCDVKCAGARAVVLMRLLYDRPGPALVRKRAVALAIITKGKL